MRGGPIVWFCIVMVAAAISGGAIAAEDAWPEFRGPTQQGHAPGADPPINWSEGRNIRFKTAIPGQGWSSPVLMGNQIWMTTATDDGHSLRAVCVDRNSGAVTRDVEVFHVDTPPRINSFNSYASPSPVIEDGRLYVCFGGAGIACLDTASGKPIWRSNALRVEHMEGAGSSPILYRDYFILNCDGIDAQFVAALNKTTGALAWKTSRTTPFPITAIAPFRKAYATPIIIHVGNKDQLISPAARRIYACDPQDGREIWHVDLEPPAYNTAPRPVFGNGVLYFCTGYDHPELWAVRVDESTVGDVTSTHVLWKYSRGAPLKPSPLLMGDELYMVGDYGIAKCLDTHTGQEIWRSRIGSTFSASPVEAGGRLYFFGEGGRSVVLQTGKQFKILADNYLEGGGCLATPAFSGKAIFLRSRTHLYCIQN